MFVMPAVPSHHSECFRERDACMWIQRKAKKRRTLEVVSSLFAVGKYSSFISEM
jgi:hypothetical protein